MDKNLSEEESDSIDWDTESEPEVQEIQDTAFSTCMNLRTTGHHAFSGDAEASSSSGSCWSKFIQQFQEMGFPKESIAKAIEQNGDNFDLVLNALLTFKALEETPDEQPSASPQLESCLSSDDSSSEYYENFLDDVYEEDSWSSDSDDCKLSEKEQKLLSLRNMGYSEEDASIAIERCGPEALLGILIDFISAAEWAREEDRYLPEDIKPKVKHIPGGHKKRRMYNELCKRKKQRAIAKEETIRLPKPMIRFRVPMESPLVVQRALPEQAIGPLFSIMKTSL